VSVECCQVGVYATGCFLVQSSPTKCGVSERDGESSNVRRHWPIRGCWTTEKEMLIILEFRHPRRGVNEVFALWDVR
jgi:hypothetical protein